MTVFLGLALAIVVFSVSGAMLFTVEKFSDALSYMDAQNLIRESLAYLTTSTATLVKVASVASLVPALALVLLNVRASLSGRSAFFTLASFSSVLSAALYFLNAGSSRDAFRSGILFISGLAGSLTIGYWVSRQRMAQPERQANA